MLFNSIEFLIFLPIVFFAYWLFFSKKEDRRNIFLIAVSYLFYGWWDWRFLFLIIVSSFLDFYIGKNINKTENPSKRKLLLLLSICFNIGMLGVLKYFNFFIAEFIAFSNLFGLNVNEITIKIILPVGISFYTFQTLSYSIDIYKKKIKHTDNIFAFLAFVSFFPQLVAGPIERAKSLLPQFSQKKEMNYPLMSDGFRQILWGFFKKVVIADNLAPNVNYIFDNYETLPASMLFIGILFFAFQIYADFSGYSDIAIGTAKLFGFNLMTNFATPYFSRNIREFWYRWHISLSTWFRDYVYIPLGGSKVNKFRQAFNIIVTFTISGLWHGANLTFVIWGALNGLYYLPSIVLKSKKHKNIVAYNKIFPSIKELFQMMFTFLIVLITWVFFRAETLTDAFRYILNMLNISNFGNVFKEIYLMTRNLDYIHVVVITIALPVMILLEWLQRHKKHTFDIGNYNSVSRWTSYIILTTIIILFGNFSNNEFIYFQF
ncbi:MAG: MBOAT family protein [Bacteroidales bacterium]|nr:MBOAT family protein [Bacteroidales bacterium]